MYVYLSPPKKTTDEETVALRKKFTALFAGSATCEPVISCDPAFNAMVVAEQERNEEHIES